MQNNMQIISKICTHPFFFYRICRIICRICRIICRICRIICRICRIICRICRIILVSEIICKVCTYSFSYTEYAE
jgi:hypothetical protein